MLALRARRKKPRARKSNWCTRAMNTSSKAGGMRIRISRLQRIGPAPRRRRPRHVRRRPRLPPLPAKRVLGADALFAFDRADLSTSPSERREKLDQLAQDVQQVDTVKQLT